MRVKTKENATHLSRDIGSRQPHRRRTFTQFHAQFALRAEVVIVDGVHTFKLRKRKLHTVSSFAREQRIGRTNLISNVGTRRSARDFFVLNTLRFIDRTNRSAHFIHHCR